MRFEIGALRDDCRAGRQATYQAGGDAAGDGGGRRQVYAIDGEAEGRDGITLIGPHGRLQIEALTGKEAGNDRQRVTGREQFARRSQAGDDRGGVSYGGGRAESGGKHDLKALAGKQWRGHEGFS